MKVLVKLMSGDLPSINDFKEDRSNLPSIKDFIKEKPTELSESVESELPSYKRLLEKKESAPQDIEEEVVVEPVAGGNFLVLLALIESVRNSIPEVKSYDKELFELVQLIEEVRKEIPVVPEPPVIPEVRYYDDEIQNTKESIPVVPEVKYYDGTD